MQIVEMVVGNVHGAPLYYGSMIPGNDAGAVQPCRRRQRLLYFNKLERNKLLYCSLLSSCFILLYVHKINNSLYFQALHQYQESFVNIYSREVKHTSVGQLDI